MFIMKKVFAIALALILVLGCFAGCGSKEASDMAAVKKAGKIVVGITDYAPMDYLDENGQWTGFDAEFARLFAEELGVECEFYVIADWGKKFIELETKNIDYVIDTAELVLANSKERRAGSAGEEQTQHIFMNELKNFCDETNEDQFRTHPGAGTLAEKLLCALLILCVILFYSAVHILLV